MQSQKFFYQKFCSAIEPHTYAIFSKSIEIYLQSLLIEVLYILLVQSFILEHNLKQMTLSNAGYLLQFLTFLLIAN
jgi:hypothetical protein